MSLTHATCHALTLTMLVFGLAPAVGFADPPVKRKANGAYITVYGFNGCLYTYLNASKGGTTAAPETYLYYEVWDACAEQTLAYGNGLIPNTALKVSTKGATLAVTPKVSATFVAQGALGAIKLAVTPDGVYTSTSSGHSEYTYPGVVVRAHGSSTSKSATASGTTMLGTVETYGEVGTSRERYFEFQRRSK